MKLTLAIIALLIPMSSIARVEIAPTFSIYDDDRLKSDLGLKLAVGGSVYVWASYEQPGLQLVGQNMGSLELLGAGLGIRHELNDRFSVFGELGHFFPSTDPLQVIRDEAVSTSLENDHGTPPAHWDHTVYHLNSHYGTRLGLSYALSDRFYLSAAYKYLSLNESLDACTGPDDGCNYPVDGLHWQNRKTLKLSSFEAGFGVRF